MNDPNSNAEQGSDTPMSVRSPIQGSDIFGRQTLQELKNAPIGGDAPSEEEMDPDTKAALDKLDRKRSAS